MRPPKIGITVPRQHSSTFRDYLRRIRDAGGEPIELTPTAADTDDTAQFLAGLLLPGGGDVDPALYGAAARAETSGVQDELDAIEIGLVRRAQAAGMPVLAICRGHQLLNVALGGSLHQHIEGDSHRAQEGEPHPSRWHEVCIARGSRLALLLGAGSQRMNSRHHQAVLADALAPGLRAVATSPDGIVEACEARDGSWMVSVQWHPEREEMWARSRPLFEDFLRAAAAWQPVAVRQ